MALFIFLDTAFNRSTIFNMQEEVIKNALLGIYTM